MTVYCSRNLALIIDGSTLAYIHGIAEFVAVALCPIAHLFLHIGPYFTIENTCLWLHVGEIESLIVLLKAHQSICRRTYMAMIIAWAIVAIAIAYRPWIFCAQDRIQRILVWIFVWVRIIVFNIEAVYIWCHDALVHLVARPALRLLLHVPLYAIVEYTIAFVNKHHIVLCIAIQARKLQSTIFCALLCRVGIGIGGKAIFIIIAWACN